MKLNSKIKVAIAAAIIGSGSVLFYACNEIGNGAGLDPSGKDTVGTGPAAAGCPDTVKAAFADNSANPVSFANDILPIFTTASKCTQCHAPGGVGYSATGGANGGLDLTAPNAYASLVRSKRTYEDSTSTPYFRVAPGDSGCSYLINKITGVGLKPVTHGGSLSQKMPIGSSPLTSDQIEKIRLWIQHGASND